MRLLKIFIISLVLVSCGSRIKTPKEFRIPKNYDYTPVLLHLSTGSQTDSVGFNLVEELPKLLYPRLLTGDLPLWETSKKENKMSKERFIDLEKKAQYPFTSSKDLFIHEFWQIFKNNFEFGVAGFSFGGLSKTGSKISYGYVDGADIIDLLQTTYIPTNANGTATLTFWNALMSKKYPFKLVQFGNENFQTNEKRSYLIGYQAIFDPKVNRDFFTYEVEKEIEYRIVKPGITSNIENKTLFKSLEAVLNKNKQTILNAGGAEHFSHMDFKTWKLDEILVTERWTKYKNIAFQDLQQVQVFIEGHPIVLDKDQLEELNAKINLQGIEEYMNEKRFDFVLQRINSQEIRPQESERYYKALVYNAWGGTD